MSLKINKHILLLLTVMFILFLIPFSSASDNNTDLIGDGITVDDTTIYVSNGENEGSGSQDNPYNSVSDAVENYNSSKNSNIYIKNGNYIIDNQIELNKDVTIIGQSREGVVLDANNQNSIFKISSDSKVTFINLTFKNAKSSAIFLDSYTYSDVDIDNCIFENNNGGAIYYKSAWGDSSTTSIVVKNSIFTNNYNVDGGAVYIYGGKLLNISNSKFENNRCPTGESDVSDGGAIYGAGNIKNIYINACNFTNNSATRGSAISQYCGGNLYISNSIFTNNTSPGNNKYKVNSSVIYDVQSNPRELTLYLNKNIIENNILNNDIFTSGNVKVEYLDKNTKITADNVDKIYGDDYNYIVTLTDNEGNPLIGKTITVRLTNNYNNEVTVISNITDDQGRAVISLKTQKPGKYSALAMFKGDSELNDFNKTNVIFIKTENNYNLIFEENNIRMSEGDSYNVSGIIYDEYYVPTNALDGVSFTIDWIDNFGKHLAINVNSIKITNGKLVYDINRLHLVTRDEAYEINFNISTYTSSTITVDLSKDLSNVDGNLDTLYVSKEGSDETGDGSKSNPLATLRTALSANYKFGGGKTIIVGEGIYEISTFNVLGNVTIIGSKSKTILKQTNGILGMLEIDSGNTVKLINLTFIDGYATPSPDALIHVADDSIAYIENCEFVNNSAVEGGAISISSGGSVFINNSYFHNNTAILSRNGGAIYVDRGYLYISNSIFENNTAGDGGAIYLGFTSEATIINSTFINNSAIGSSNYAGSGGAIFTRSNNLLIENSTFKENYADYGGAIFIDYGAVYIYRSYFENNVAHYSAKEKGSVIEGSSISYCNLTMHYSILISDDDSSYLVYIPNFDENHTADVNYNYWKTSGLKSNTGVSQEVRIVISIDNEYIYSGDVVEFTINLLNYNVENGTSPLNDSVHDFSPILSSTIGVIENPNVTIKNNKAYFIYSATTIGEEVINLKYLTFDLLKYKFNVLDGSDKIKVNSTFDIIPDKQSIINIIFNESMTGNVTVKINDDSYSVKVEDSKVSLKINTTPGEYTVKVIYQGDETYRGFIASETFTVDKFESILTVENITVYYNGDFKAVLKDNDGNPIKNEKVYIKINEETFSAITDENGIAILVLNLPSTGTYDVMTTFNGNSNYNSSEANSTITVIFADVKLTADENVEINPIKGSFSFKLTDNKNNPIKNTKVIITFNNDQFEVKTDENGIATLDLNNNGLAIGKYDISAKVDSTPVYSEASLNASFNVVKATATLNAENITVYANNGELIVYLIDEDETPIIGKNITLKIGSEPTKVITTDEDGKAVFKLDLTSGNYTTLINIQENPIYEAASISTDIVVNENILIITAPTLTVYYSNGKFNIFVTDITGKPVDNLKLIANINKNDYVLFTNEYGVAIFDVNLPIGTYAANIKFEGNNVFKSASINSTVNVVSSISSDDLIRSYNSPYDFKATLKDENGNPVADEVVTLIVNGKTYTVKTDSYGVLLFSKKLTVGTYAITITNPATGEKTANYAQIISRITGNKDINVYFGSNPIYKVRVVGDDGKFVGASEIVKITVNGVTHSVKTDKNGYASLKINLKANKYTITATYKGYKVSNKITIKPVLTAKNISKKKAKKIKFTAKIVNTKGKPIKGKKITFKIKGKTYKIKTNKKGIATLTLKNLKIGKYKITSKYGKSTIKNTIKIRK